MAPAVTFLVLAALAPTPPAPLEAQERGAQRAFAISARKYAFTPARIEVLQDDLVTVTFKAVDIPHTFTIDAYRISKRAGAGQSVTFEFRADKPGTFPYYCDLRSDEGCRRMRGELVVTPR
jgi:heme/copper-type cytochrome/quinol oxidase subunit 2